MPKLSQASATPADFFELEFQGSAGVGYRLWMRGTAAGNSYANDSVFVQFSDSVTSGGSATYRIGTSGAVVYGIEDCSGCGVAGWGWNDNVYGAALGDRIYFKTTGVHTIRVQAREDGISIDQIVLSPVTYASKAPGALKNDTVILPAPGMPPAPAPAPDPAPAPAPTPAPAPAPTPAPTPDPAPAPTPSNLAPVFEAAPDGFRIAEFTQGSAPVTVYLSASATGPEATDALTYTWDFGDGSPVVTTRPSAEASRQNLPHTYTSAGTFTATVIVTDQAHNQSSQSGTVVVGAPAPFTGEQLKVMLWNTYKGRTTDTRTEGSKIWLFARWMAAARPDVVLLQEVMGRSAANKYKAALELETGVTWSYFFRTNAGTDSSTAEGVAIMTRLPILATASMPYTVCASARIPQRSAIAVTVPVNGRNVTIFDTHLSSYEGAAEIACRTKQGQELTTFAATFAEPRIIGGDLNADPLEPVMVNLLATYHDTWDLAMAAARAISYPDNPPETLVTKSERIDYVLSSKGAQVVDVLNVQVPDTRDYTNDNPVAAAGASNWAPHNAAPRVSDHETIIATFAVR